MNTHKMSTHKMSTHIGFDTGTGNLKPSRIGHTQMSIDRGALKPSRIGLRLQKLPGWELATDAGNDALWRTFRFHTPDTAQAFATFAASLADEHGQRPVVAQVWNQVTVTLTGGGGLSDAALDFAEFLMLLPPETDGGGSTVEPQPEAPNPEVPGTEVPGGEVPGPEVPSGPTAQPGPTVPPTQPGPTAQPEAPTGAEGPPVAQPFVAGRS